jgi:Domain of unknown function (DUF4276)
MKVGMVYECGPDGADIKVCENLAKRLAPDIELCSPTTLDNAEKLIRESGKVAKNLLEIDHCDLVIIIWDFYPRRGKPPCIVYDCNKIKEKFDEAKLTEKQKQHIYLVCIQNELEAWLLADERAFESYFKGIKNKDYSVKRFRHPEYFRNPKKELEKIFEDAIGRKYEDRRDAEEIIKRVEIQRLKCCTSFVRFARRVAGDPVAAQKLRMQFSDKER